MLLLQKIFFLCFISVTIAQTNDDYEGCRPFYTHNYGYKMYFHIPKSAIIGNNSIYLVISVKAQSDAHILLSSTPSPKDTDLLYEIVFGAGGNTFSDIRRLNQRSYRATNFTFGILNKNVFKKFWIKADNGLFSIGKGESMVPIVQLKDNNSFPIQYMSFSSWSGTSAMWYFDCVGAISVPVNKTVSDRLKKDLLTKYDPYVVPTTDDDTVLVNSFLLINHIDLDMSSSSMKVTGNLRLQWVDPKLQWASNKYAGIKFLRFTERSIWQPSFILYNGATLYQKWFDDGVLKVDSGGNVVWITFVNIVTRCHIKMDNWPSDQHTCQIQIGLDPAQQNVYLSELKGLSMDNGGNVGSWKLLSVKGNVVHTISPQDQQLPDANSSEIEKSSVLNIDISIKRYSSIHYYVLHVPLKVSMVISAISFCLPYSCSQRIIIQVIVLITYIMNLLSIASVLPNAINKTPSIITLNCSVFMTAVIGTILTVWLMLFSQKRNSFALPKAVDKLVNFFNFCLNYSSNFGKKGRKLMNLEDEENDGQSPAEVEKQDKKTSIGQYKAFLTLIDSSLLFSVVLVYAILIIIY